MNLLRLFKIKDHGCYQIYFKRLVARLPLKPDSKRWRIQVTNAMISFYQVKGQASDLLNECLNINIYILALDLRSFFF